MAGKTSLHNSSYMTTLSLLRETAAADALTAAAAKALFDAADKDVIRRLDREISTGPTVGREGLNQAYGGVLRLVVYPKADGGALPGNVAVYAQFRLVDKWTNDGVTYKTLADPVLIGKYPKGTAEGAIVVDIPNPPNDVVLAVLADQPARIFYSQSV